MYLHMQGNRLKTILNPFFGSGNQPLPSPPPKKHQNVTFLRKMIMPFQISLKSEVFFHTLFVPDKVHVETQVLHPMISTEFCNCWNRFNINSYLTLAPRLNCKLNVVLQHWWDPTSLNFVNGEWNVWKLPSNASFVFEFKFYLQLITNEHFELRKSHRTLDFLIQTQRFLWQQKCVAFSAKVDSLQRFFFIGLSGKSGPPDKRPIKGFRRKTTRRSRV